MEMDDIMQKAFGAPSINATEIEAFCQREQITATAFLEKFVRQIVTGYVEGRFTWLACDTAMNGLSGLMTQYKIFLITHGEFFSLLMLVRITPILPI